MTMSTTEKIEAVVRSVLWPRVIKAETTALIRTGRVLHWTGLVLALPFVFGGVALAFTIPDPNGIWVSLIGLVPYMIGRGLRYIFANE
jgi:hypothetical protein